MLNLLPQQEKVLLKKEYSARRLAVWLGAITAVLVVSLVLLAPSFILTRVKANEVRGELEATKLALDAELPPKEIITELEAAVRHADALKPFAKPTSVRELVKIFESKPPSIRITGISFLEHTDSRPTIQVRGVAQTRESLTSFGRAIEGRVEFETVDLPVSNFVKEKNIDFSMSITLK